MDHIEKRFSVISEPAGFALLIDEVTSCITDDKIYGTVATPLSVDEALALGRALVEAAQAAQAAPKSAFRISVDKALAAARATAARKAVGNA
jgi:hypothetical protein